MNYVHVGEGIRFFQNGARPAVTSNFFSSVKELIIIQRGPDNISFLGQDDDIVYSILNVCLVDL